MSTPKESLVSAYYEFVEMRYQLYNGLFLTLPYANLPEVGTNLPIFTELCEQYISQGKTPKEIIQHFFEDILLRQEFSEQMAILFLMLQFVERQVVLLDALEDSAFTKTHDMEGEGSLAHLLQRITAEQKQQQALQRLQSYRTRIVLTAHPTQFYPPPVLSMIHDLGAVIGSDNLAQIRELLLQLSRTPFRNQRRPTPFDEAESLIHYLEYVFYPVVRDLHYQLFCNLRNEQQATALPAVIEIGFWPGGDRDGNPYVTSKVTLRVARQLKYKILGCYIGNLRKIHRRLTFTGIWEKLREIIACLRRTQQAVMQDKPSEVDSLSSYDSTSTSANETYATADALLDELTAALHLLKTKHSGLFSDMLEKVILAVNSFGFHFAALDLRQDSRIHTAAVADILDTIGQCHNYQSLADADKEQLIVKLISQPPVTISETVKQQNPIIKDTIESLQAAKLIQQQNGVAGLERYIISNTQTARNILEVLLLAHWSGWSLEQLTLDIIPLFETVDDLTHSLTTMESLYQHPIYKKHLASRGNVQTIMFGFSDGTKDGGYLAANYTIYQAKAKQVSLARRYNIDLIFFDGRGGPPGRGGGNTHKFYKAQGTDLDMHRVQLTIQGQTISSNYETLEKARYNIEQLFTAGFYTELFPKQNTNKRSPFCPLLDRLSEVSLGCYQQLKANPLFVPYLEEVTPLHYYTELNIASRPASRSVDQSITFEDLRAIPFVGSWAQMKQNIPGFYGLGTALEAVIKDGALSELQTLYCESLFFHTVLENAMESLMKSRFELTEYLAKDATFSHFWQQLKAEAVLTEKMLLLITGQKALLENDPVVANSIQLREQLVLPLLVIQQYALQTLRENGGLEQIVQDTYPKLIRKSLAANINASRNSA